MFEPYFILPFLTAHELDISQIIGNSIRKAYNLFEAWACGNLRFAQHRFDAALPFLGEALYVEVVKDGLSVSEMMKLLDQVGKTNRAVYDCLVYHFRSFST